MRNQIWLWLPLFCVSIAMRGHSEQEPLWRIDLRVLGAGDADNANVRFCGKFLVVRVSRLETLTFDPAKREQLRNQEVSEAALPSCTPVQQSSRQSESDQHVVGRWKGMVLEEVCDVKNCTEPPGQPAVRNVTYYLARVGKPRTPLFNVHCLPRDPQFVGDDYVLFYRCNMKGVVLNTDGQKVYTLPTFAFPYIAVNQTGTRFVVYDRDESFFHELEGTTNRLRITVFQSSTGTKLFDIRWNTNVNRESARDGRVALSNDGSLLAVLRSGEVLLFAVPPQTKE